MKIVKKENRECTFVQLKQGEVFTNHEGEYCMKIETCCDGDDTVNFILLANGGAGGWMGDNVMVTKVNCELVIKD